MVFADGGFLESCSDVHAYISGAQRGVYANCRRDDGSINDSIIDLAACFGNSNGNLVCQEG